MTDGSLIQRYLFGFRGKMLIEDAVAPDCADCTAEAIEAAIVAIWDPLDIDGDRAVKPLTDSLLLLRYLSGFRGSGLIAGAVDPACSRCTAEEIEGQIQTLVQ